MMLQPLSSPKLQLYLKVFVVDLLYISVGCILTWPSPLIRKLGLSTTESSWVGALMALGASLGPALNTWAMSHLGRKMALFGAGGTFLVSWAILAASSSFPIICVARVIGGAAMGVAFIGIPIYLTEIADVAERQAVTTFTEFFLGIGYLIVYLGGPRLSYLAIQAVCAAISVIFLASFTIMPESPVYLVSKGRKDKALEVLTNLRKSLPEAQTELSEIENYLAEKSGKEEEGILEALSKPGHTKVLLLSLFALALQQLSGVIVLICYLELILDELSLPLEPATAAVIIGSGNLPSLFISPPMVRYLGTKVTLVICSAIMSVSVIIFTVYQHYDLLGYDVAKFDFIPITVLFLYNIFFCSGLGPLTWSVVAEISPPSIKGFTCFVSSTICWLIAFVLLLAFQPASSLLGGTTVFSFFAGCLVIGTIILQICLPDTKGLSLNEIQDIITGKRTKTSIKESRVNKL